MDTEDTILETKKCRKFNCEYCDFGCNKKSNMDKHIMTSKHIKRSKMIQNDTDALEKNAEKYICKCGKIYKYHSGLWRHQKECDVNSSNVDNNQKKDTEPQNVTNNVCDKELVMFLIKQNAELLELVKNGTHNTTNNTTNNNSHNKTFNLQFFLNETCKNAMNIMDFVDQIVLNLNDLEETGKIGFAEGVSKMILKRLKSLDITERPIHCSDAKRETLYIKDEDLWEKEDETNPKLTKAVKDIAYKNIRQIKTWQEKYPDYRDPSSKTNDKYMKMLTNVMAGGTIEEMEKNYEKIIKNIAKETIIDKSNFLI
jgi:hypothetical protein